MTPYKAQSARDAQRIGYGDRGYWNMLETSAHEHRNFFLRHGMPEVAESMLTQTLSEALAGNDGD